MHTSTRFAAAVTLGLLLTALAWGTALADPAGNNGTVKIHDGEGEPASINANQPKVCPFHIHGFGFDANQQLTFAISGHGGPNAGPSTYQNTATTDADGEVRDPASGAIELDDGMYRLDVETGEPGGAKHKVFKVECDEALAGAAGGGGDAQDEVTNDEAGSAEGNAQGGGAEELPNTSVDPLAGWPAILLGAAALALIGAGVVVLARRGGTSSAV